MNYHIWIANAAVNYMLNVICSENSCIEVTKLKSPSVKSVQSVNPKTKTTPRKELFSLLLMYPYTNTVQLTQNKMSHKKKNARKNRYEKRNCRVCLG